MWHLTPYPHTVELIGERNADHLEARGPYQGKEQ